MESHGLRRKDTTKGPPLRILSLDGGGVRGYSMLILLQELMYRTYVETEGKAPRRDQIPKPCDVFDLIAGTGTGGLIAIMLGRLRLDLETCKEVYIRMTKRVFETDKTIAGIPYRSTLFKASKLEDAIRDCVREHTIFDDEGNDGTEHGNNPTLTTPSTPRSVNGEFPRRSISSAGGGFTPVSARTLGPAGRWGNANASMYDLRENRTKTAVTAVFKGTAKNGAPILLRSYDSRKEPPPEFNCTIWQAGRATCAIGLAFKPIQIGLSTFLDEGAGKYNPAPQILDEAVLNEWPGREIGTFVSVGTGKRPSGTNDRQHEWWEGFVGGGIGDFAEARRRLITKIEGCEETHQFMRTEYLAKRGINPENYYRLNVEVGVGDFGMNEWSRVADISTSTRRYLAKSDVQRINVDAATKMARIERAKRRQVHYTTAGELDGYEKAPPPEYPLPPSDPTAVELPGEEIQNSSPRPPRGPQYPTHQGWPYQNTSTDQDKFSVVSSDVYSPQTANSTYSRQSMDFPVRNDQQYHHHRTSNNSMIPSPRQSSEIQRPIAPPLPPKTPIPPPDGRHPAHRNSGGVRLPYPDTEGPPPAVNMARKPEFSGR